MLTQQQLVAHLLLILGSLIMGLWVCGHMPLLQPGRSQIAIAAN
jgi:hypothetical protein